MHGYILRYNMPIRLTRAELETHPEVEDHWHRGQQTSDPVRLAGGTDCRRQSRELGLLQLCDKYEGEFTAEAVTHFVQAFTRVTETLEALWRVRRRVRRRVRHLKKQTTDIPK